MDVATTECVYFKKDVDTHAIASVTIPVTMTYIYETYSGGIHQKHFKAGAHVDSIKMIMSESCGIFYESLKRKLKKK